MRFIGFALLLIATQVQAGVGVKRLDAFLAGLDTYTAQFEQVVLDTEKNKTGRFSGTFYLQRPNRFRWDYVKPDRQEIIADGSTIWLVDLELEQVSLTRQEKALRGTPARLLTGDKDLRAEFDVVELGNRLGLDWLELIPRDKESQFVRILLAFQGNELRRMETSDKLGQISRFTFTGIQRNKPLDPELFVYKERPGIDVFVH